MQAGKKPSSFTIDDASKKRLPIPLEALTAIQEECVKIDDENRWLLALISDTGMRLSEAVGLHVEDILINQSVLFIDLKPHPWHPLKTAGSQRQIPLIVSSYWAARRLKQINEKYAFPKYIHEN